LHLLLCILSKR